MRWKSPFLKRNNPFISAARCPPGGVLLRERMSAAGESIKILKIFVDFSGETRIIILRMDTLIKRGSAGNDLPGEPEKKSYIVGSKQLRKALQKGLIHQVYLAMDADPVLTEPLEELCRQKGMQCTWVRRMEELGRMCGIDVGAAAAGC